MLIRHAEGRKDPVWGWISQTISLAAYVLSKVTLHCHNGRTIKVTGLVIKSHLETFGSVV